MPAAKGSSSTRRSSPARTASPSRRRGRGGGTAEGGDFEWEKGRRGVRGAQAGPQGRRAHRVRRLGPRVPQADRQGPLLNAEQEVDLAKRIEAGLYAERLRQVEERNQKLAAAAPRPALDRPRRRAGQEPPAGGEPAPRGLAGQALHRPRHGLPRPDPGGQPRPDPRRREVRLHQGLQVLHLRHLVDPPGHHPRHGRPGPHHPHPGAHGRGHQQARPHPARAAPGPGPRAHAGGAGQGDGHHPEKVLEILQYAREPVGLDQTVGDEGDSQLGDFIEDPRPSSRSTRSRSRCCRTSCSRCWTPSPSGRRRGPAAVRPRRRSAAHPRRDRPGLRADPGADPADRVEDDVEAAPPVNGGCLGVSSAARALCRAEEPEASPRASPPLLGRAGPVYSARARVEGVAVGRQVRKTAADPRSAPVIPRFGGRRPARVPSDPLQ